MRPQELPRRVLSVDILLVEVVGDQIRQRFEDNIL